ncbi:response regulator [Pseudoroseicyclus aestuarii]|uniref:Response regulator receiver domain-containing protein n=1 Tax=Pseudoroseicyclus aestuarii TaxID=1795041 RepID=A0A318SXA7_9RHOB|nr:response regulator [Pseudoroseicyclus aestuarii]PYE85975.1 response regulator receiver domain-containing protein [Pseudoroseicyclus aestuarii]
MKILHVDDDDDIREITKFALEMNGEIEVETASGGRAALERLSAQLPDVILLDVMMPEMSGPELKTVLNGRPEYCGVPVIFMTAAAQRSTIDELMGLGAAGVISKPYDPMTLADEVDRLLGAA